MISIVPKIVCKKMPVQKYISICTILFFFFKQNMYSEIGILQYLFFSLYVRKKPKKDRKHSASSARSGDLTSLE